MASFLCQVQTIQRSAGRSAIAAAAYRAGERLTDERLAMEFDFAAKGGVEFSEILAPAAAPAHYLDRQTLWNAAEKSERRKDAVPARELLLALPHELSPEQRRDLVRSFVAAHLTNRGMIADIAYHRPGSEGDQRNFHAHVLVTTRTVGPGGFGAKDTSWRTPQQVREWREAWAEIQNQHLRRHLGPDAPQVSHLSLAEQGLDRLPSQHLGPAATAMERRDRRTHHGDRNRDVDVRNRTTEQLRRDYAEAADRIASKAPMVNAPIERLVAEATRVRQGLIAERDGWSRDREGLATAHVPSRPALAQRLLDDDLTARDDTRRRFEETRARVARVRARRLELVAWIRNPARMIWAKHAELNALAWARSAVRRAELQVELRRAWARSQGGRTTIAARRQPALDAAVEAARKRRTLERKIRRMDRRIEAATDALSTLRVAQELGARELQVPARSPDATRFIRDVGAPAREAVARYPAPARQQAIERLNKGRARSLARSLSPGL